MLPIEKIRNDLEKTNHKISVLQARIRALEAKLTEAENLKIAHMVKAVELTPEQLAPILQAYANGMLTLPGNGMENGCAAPEDEELPDEY